MTEESPLHSAWRVLEQATMTLDGRAVGTVAARSEDGLAAENYEECFVRDFAVSAFAHLARGEYDMARNFLETVLHIREPETRFDAHEIPPGVMPASFRTRGDHNGGRRLVADFGDRAIGRVAPVDSMMWWMVLLHAYTQQSGDQSFAGRSDVQEGIQHTLRLCLRGSFEVFPTLLVPDASFMVDRRMGVHGHPLEIQSLFYATLHSAADLYDGERGDGDLARRTSGRRKLLRNYVRSEYWLDSERLGEIRRFSTEEFGTNSRNALNISPHAIPEWIDAWWPGQGGYFAGNLGPERMDFRFFGLGNLLAVLFGLATTAQAGRLMDLYEQRWDDLVGTVPLKLCYPALEDAEWRMLTGCDPKNVPWSYHNGGNWPALLWAFVAAALAAGRRALAERAFEQAAARLHADNWPEYYDGRRGDDVGRRANRQQTWTAASVIFARQLLDDPDLIAMFPGRQPRQAT